MIVGSLKYFDGQLLNTRNIIELLTSMLVFIASKFLIMCAIFLRYLFRPHPFFTSSVNEWAVFLLRIDNKALLSICTKSTTV
jgi:hypothetical protein